MHGSHQGVNLVVGHCLERWLLLKEVDTGSFDMVGYRPQILLIAFLRDNSILNVSVCPDRNLEKILSMQSLFTERLARLHHFCQLVEPSVTVFILFLVQRADRVECKREVVEVTWSQEVWQSLW